MKRQFEVDLDKEQVLYEGEWFGAKPLADKIRRMIEIQDFRIASAGVALQCLQETLEQARKYEVKFTPERAEILEANARRSQVSVSGFIRKAVDAYLSTYIPPPLPPSES